MPNAGARPFTLTILHINDPHSHLAPVQTTLQLRNAAGARVAVQVEAGGFPRVTAAFAKLARGRRNVIKLHAGDALSGTPYFDRAGPMGAADAAMMNTVCFDAFTLGNHEFDRGDDGLRGFIDRLHAGACRTPVLSANVHFGAGSALNPVHAPDYVLPSVVLERGGRRIGVVGLTIAGKTKASSKPDADTQFEDEAVAAQRAIDALEAAGVRQVVVLSHVGHDRDRELIARLHKVDAVVGGDSHTLLGPPALADYGVGRPAGPYAEALRNADGETACLAQAWQYARVVGELAVTFDDGGRVIRCGGAPQVLIGDDFRVAGRAPGAADRAAFAADAANSGFLQIIAPDPAAEAVLRPFRDKVEAFERQVVATAPDALCLRRLPGGPESPGYVATGTACDTDTEVAAHGGDLQQMTAQAYLDTVAARYGGADIALQGAGGAREPLRGRITAGDVLRVLPFGDTLWQLDLSGAEVHAMIEDALQAVFGPGGTTGPYPYAAGLRWRVDASQPRGRRATGLEVRNATTGAWEALDPDRRYRAVAPGFDATGGDGHATLAAVPAARRHNTGVLDADAFLAWIARQPADPAGGLPVLRKLPADLYSTQVFLNGPSMNGPSR
ncbi:bifunctional metallophosphatase/5'-nucleotidase [Pigmentiphaga soli]|uniref:Bifunctional metallophosphatase/5'-nucleotidase n=1 Tax=Pigmentiphaga soli TaxID=1007095 RepID=A0ABP8GKL2_9BURK